jgi:uncharacterized membrane protein
MTADLYEWLLFGHIVGAMVWVGGLATLTLLSMQVRRSGEPDAIRRFVGSLRSIGPVLMAPAVVLVFVLGVWMVSNSVEWDLGQRWVRIGLVLFAVAFLIGAVFQSRTAILAQRAVASSDYSEAARQLRRWSWGMGVILVLLLAVAWDMVFKPGA